VDRRVEKRGVDRIGQMKRVERSEKVKIGVEGKKLGGEKEEKVWMERRQEGRHKKMRGAK
jgi:hypothetical protein